MDIMTNKLFSLYYNNIPKVLEEYNLCRGASDFRYVYITENNNKKLVIKHTSNSFTNSERICGWEKLISEYNKLGIYCPHIIPNKNNALSYKYTENGRDYYIYAEEYAKFRIAEKIGSDKLRKNGERPVYVDDMLRAVGKELLHISIFYHFPLHIVC